jgi:hypothetical protein
MRKPRPRNASQERRPQLNSREHLAHHSWLPDAVRDDAQQARGRQYHTDLHK